MGRHGEWKSTCLDTVAAQVMDACLTEGSDFCKLRLKNDKMPRRLFLCVWEISAQNLHLIESII